MRNLIFALAVGLAGFTAVACHRLIGPTGPPFTVTGVVTFVDPTVLVLRHKTGPEVRVAVVPSTLVSTKGRRASIADVAIGMRIVVVYQFVNGVAVAHEVQLFRLGRHGATSGVGRVAPPHNLGIGLRFETT